MDVLKTMIFKKIIPGAKKTGGIIMKTEKMDHPNEGIKCMVNTCHYYMNGDHCSARKIEVEPRNAPNTKDTGCATFIPDTHA